MEFPWRCNVDTIAMDLKVSWEMSVKWIDFRSKHNGEIVDVRLLVHENSGRLFPKQVVLGLIEYVDARETGYRFSVELFAHGDRKDRRTGSDMLERGDVFIQEIVVEAPYRHAFEIPPQDTDDIGVKGLDRITEPPRCGKGARIVPGRSQKCQ